MRSAKWLFMIVLFMTVSVGVPVEAFDSGSSGADGEFSPTQDITLDLPQDGIFNFTTVNIPAGVTVRFNKNQSNTPVYILATGDVTIAGEIHLYGSDAIALSPGTGGPGGYDGGVGAPVYECGGAGHGPGGGYAGRKDTNMTYGAGGGGGSYGGSGGDGYAPYGTYYYNDPGLKGETYGNTNVLPLIGGSGGGSACANYKTYGAAGGGGGGAILIASSGTINITGAIRAGGGRGSDIFTGRWGGSNNDPNGGGGGGGSGGAIKLMASVITGEGTVEAFGGGGGTSQECCYKQVQTGGNGGNGRIRLEADILLRTANTAPSYTYNPHPNDVFPVGLPSLRIVSVGGIAVNDSATGSYATPDIVLPSLETNNIEIAVEAKNIPIGTDVTVKSIPELGNPTSSTGALSGTIDASSATIVLPLSQRYANVLVATATFNLQLTSNELPLYADGERVVKMKVETALEGGMRISYITESGREIPAS